LDFLAVLVSALEGFRGEVVSGSGLTRPDWWRLFGESLRSKTNQNWTL
jgi:hypothetical protein